MRHPFRDKTDKQIRKPWREYKLHITVLVIAVIAQLIGVRNINFGGGFSIVLMPLVYAMLMGLILYLAKPVKFIGRKQSKMAEGAMLIFIGILLAKLAVSSGESMYILTKVGPALILQELGNLGTIFFALPIALILGFKREAIGMTSSVCRETNLGIIIDKYGFNSPEAKGVFSVFVIGTMIGTIFISFLASICASIIPFHPYAFAMASGIGSASMNAAAISPLIYMFPDMASTLQAFAGFSNVLSFCFGVYSCIFLALPLTEFLYKFLEPKIGRNVKNVSSSENLDEDSSNNEVKYKDSEVKSKKPKRGVSKRRIAYWSLLLAVFSLITVVVNYVGYHKSIPGSFIGMLILSFIALAGLLLERVLPWDVSNIIYISIIGLILALPFSPTSNFVVNYVSQIDLISICTVFLAYVGIGIGRDWKDFKKIGWRGVIVTMFVIAGTYLCSASVAQIVLVLTNSI